MSKAIFAIFLLTLVALLLTSCAAISDGVLAASEGWQAAKDKQARLEVLAADLGVEYSKVQEDIESAKARIEEMKASGASVESVAIASQELARLSGRAVELKGTIDKAITAGAEEVDAWKARYESAKQGEGSLPPWLDMLIYGVASLGGVGAIWQKFKRGVAENALGKVAKTNADALDADTLKALKTLNAGKMTNGEKKALKVGLVKV